MAQTAGKDVIYSLLEVLDDCDRAEKQIAKGMATDEFIKGVLLVFTKLRNIMAAKGLRPMESVGKPFDPDQHEAVSQIPAPNDQWKGKVFEELEKGYFLNDKIIRYAKVVVAV